MPTVGAAPVVTVVSGIGKQSAVSFIHFKINTQKTSSEMLLTEQHSSHVFKVHTLLFTSILQ